jgi:cysteine desulfurase
LLHGAGHEAGRRAGTENTILIAGLGAAARAARVWVGMESVRALRDRMQQEISERWGGRTSLNGHPDKRLPNTLSVNFHGRAGADLLAAMPEVAASTGSACHSGAVELSPVLRAMGVAPEAGMGAIRFSLGRGTTAEEIDKVLSLLEQALR